MILKNDKTTDFANKVLKALAKSSSKKNPIIYPELKKKYFIKFQINFLCQNTLVSTSYMI